MEHSSSSLAIACEMLSRARQGNVVVCLGSELELIERMRQPDERLVAVPNPSTGDGALLGPSEHPLIRAGTAYWDRLQRVRAEVAHG